MKKKSLLWISVLLLILVGCSSDDESLLNQNWKPNTLLINSENAEIKEYSVINNHFYIDKH